MKTFACRSTFIRLLAALIMVFTMALPAVAQGEDDTIIEEDGIVVVNGTLTFDGDVIMVAGYIIAPASAFIPADYSDGDKVIVTGFLLADGETIQAISIELFDNGGDDECDPEVDEVCPPVDDECDPEVDEVCPPVDDECDPEVDENCPPVDDECDPEVDEDCEEEIVLPDAPCATAAGHVGQRIADDFEVNVKAVMAMRCDGYGFGEIVIALTLADGDKDLLDEIMALREDGYGWGRIKRMDWDSGDDEETLAERKGKRLIGQGPRNAGRGNAGGNGNGGEDRGNGNGKGNAGGNGNGRGNGNGNGGTGNGKGKP